MSDPYFPEIIECPMCGEMVESDLIMFATGVCCDCDPENVRMAKADFELDCERGK